MWSCVYVFATFASERKKDATRNDALGNLVITKNNPDGESEHHMTIIELDLMLKTVKEEAKQIHRT